jgi:hypothetical protein
MAQVKIDGSISQALLAPPSRSASGHCVGTPHSFGSKPAQCNILPDKSGVPAETMQLDFFQWTHMANEVYHLNK